MKKMLTMVLVAACMFSGVALAALVEGEVVSVDAAQNKLILKTMDDQGAASESSVVTDASTKLTGVASLAELAAGDEVWAEAEQDATTKDWKASSIEKVTQ